MKKITKIVTFYDDGTFTESTPSPGYMPTQPYIPPAPLVPNPYTWPQPYWPNPPLYTVTSTSTTYAPQTEETKE